MTDTRRVEDLANFGKPLIEFPKKAQRQQARIFMSEIRKRYGTFGLVRFFVRVFVERRRLKHEYTAVFSRLQRIMGPGAVKETLMLVSMFNVIARLEGREDAYPVIQSMTEKVAPYSMRAMYQVDDLVRCEGDVFDNFKKFHMAMFNADAMQPIFRNTQTEADDHFTTTVDECINVEVFAELDCPELAPFGCDHDLAGYPAIADSVEAEFRRPCTIAKGAETCEFRFYRKGTAPDTELIGGVPVKWEASLNR
jgi:hypothetical protein